MMTNLTNRSRPRSIAIIFAATLVVAAVQYSQGAAPQTQARAEITINDTDPQPENLTSTKDGTVFFGSTTKGTIYRAVPSQSQAEPWIKGEGAGMVNTMGLLADEKAGTLWVCANRPFGRNTSDSIQIALRAFDLKTGAPKGTFAVSGGGVVNDVALAKDGAVYVSDTFGGRILRLKRDAKELEVWATDAQLRGIDGLTFLADGALYVNNIFNGKLLRVAVGADGKVGPIVEIQTSLPFQRPDGMRTSNRNTLLQVEGQGRLTETTITGDKGEVRVIKEGLSNAIGVTPLGDSALVLVERRKAVTVPIPPK